MSVLYQGSEKGRGHAGIVLYDTGKMVSHVQIIY